MQKLGGEARLLQPRTLTGTFRVRYEVVLETLAFTLIEANPALGKKRVRIREDIRVHVEEDGRHADDGLQSIRRS